MTIPKLTPSQRRLLEDIVKRPKPVVDYYKPAQVLIRLDLAEWIKSERHWTTTLNPTQKGRELIEELTK